MEKRYVSEDFTATFLGLSKARIRKIGFDRIKGIDGRIRYDVDDLFQYLLREPDDIDFTKEENGHE